MENLRVYSLEQLGVDIDAFRSDSLTRTQVDHMAETAYKVSAWVQRCVEIKAMSASDIPWELLAGGQVLGQNAPAMQLLKNPNKRTTWRTLAGDVFRDLDIFGRAFWYKNLDRNGHVVELMRINPAQLEVKTAGNNITGYEVVETNKILPRKNIVHFREYDPVSDIGGYSLVTNVVYKAFMEGKLDKTLDKFFENQAVPALIASSNTAVVVEDPREKGKANILPAAICPERGCRRSISSPVLKS